jgi:ABC-type Fe3+-hydroxamate transport system substrate-binding protein
VPVSEPATNTDHKEPHPMKKFLGLFAAFVLLVTLSACSSSADTVSANLSTEADNFKVLRRVVLYNGITDSYPVSVTGYCSLGNDDAPDRVSVTCKVGDDENNPDSYVKDIFLKSDNTIVMVQQLHGMHVSKNHYEMILKPSTLVPDISVQ